MKRENKIILLSPELLFNYIYPFKSVTFHRSFRFTANFRGRYRYSSHTRCPNTCIASPIINDQDGIFITIDEPTLTHHNYSKFTVYLRVHSWDCTVTYQFFEATILWKFNWASVAVFYILHSSNSDFYNLRMKKQAMLTTVNNIKFCCSWHRHIVINFNFHCKFYLVLGSADNLKPARETVYSCKPWNWLNINS